MFAPLKNGDIFIIIDQLKDVVRIGHGQVEARGINVFFLCCGVINDDLKSCTEAVFV